MIPSGATVLFLLEASRFRPFRHAHPFSYCPLAFGWRGVASRHFRHLPRPSPRWSMPRAPWFFSCGRATAPPIIRSSVHLPRHLRPAPQVHSRPSSSISRSHSCTYCHAFLCSRHSVSGEPRVVQPFILLAIRRKARRIRTPSGPAVHLHSLSATGGRIRTASGPGVHLHSLSAAKKAYPDPEWSSRSSSLVTRRQEGPAVHLQSLSAARKASPDPGWSSRPSHSLSAARKAYPDPEWSSRSSLLAIRRQEGVSGPRVVQAFIFNCYPPPGRRFRTATGPGVYRHSLSAARKAYPDRDSSRRLSSLVIRHQEGVSGSRVVQVFILTRYPPPGRRIGTPSGPGAHLHSLSASRKAYPDPELSRRSSALAVRLEKGVSGPRVVQPFIFTHCPPPGRRFQTATGPTVHHHSLSAARKAHPVPEWSSRSSTLAIRCQEGVSRPRLVQVNIFTRYPPPGSRTRTPSGPAVHLHSLSAARKAYPDPEWSRRSSALTIRLQKGVSGPRVVQAFVRTRYPPRERRIGTPSGPAVHFHSLSATGKAFPDPEWSSCSSTLAIRCQEGVSRLRLVQVIIFTRYPPPGSRTRTRVVQPFIFTRYPPPGRRIRTPSGPGVHPHSLSASRKAYRDPELSSRSSSLAVRCQEGVSGPWMVQPFIFTRSPPPGRRIRTPSGPGVHLHSLSAARKAYPDPEWSRRSSALAIRLQKGVSGPRVVQPFIFTRSPLPGRRIRTPDGQAVHLHSLSATGKAYSDRDWSYRSSSLAIRRQEGAPRPRVVQPFIFTRYPLPGRRIRTATGPGDYLHSLSASRKAYRDPEWSSRSSSLAIRRQEGVSGPRVVQASIRTRYPPPERRIGTPSGPVVHLHSLSAARKGYRDPECPAVHFHSLSAARKAYRDPSGPSVHLQSLSAARKAVPDRDWSRRSSSLVYPPPGRRIRSRGANRSS